MKTTLTTLILFFSLHAFAQQVENIKIKSLNNKPIISAKINGKKCYFLVDTGSDISVINSTQLKKYNLTEKKIYNDSRYAIGFSGQTAAIMRVDQVKVNFTESFDHRAFYSLNIDRLVDSIEAKTTYRISGIVGADFLIKYNCIIDYNQRHITLVNARSKKNFAAN